MLKTIKLAKKGIGHTSPNPLVGAIIVKNNKIIGQGYHKKAGDDHAEIAALKKTGKKARGATMYINLEPCCHFGKTPPCTKAIISAGIKEIHIAMLDPNSKVCGKGKKELEKADIKVIVGEERDKAKKLNEIFCKYIKNNVPFVLAKWAMSLDGKIATHTGDSKWITNKKSRSLVQELRQKYDAILVGVNTVLKDNPRLTARAKTSRPSNPIRIIVDSAGRTPLTANVLKNKQAKTIIATTEKISKKREELYVKLGAQVIKIKSKNKRVNLKELIKKLGKLEITSILIEGGGEILASAVSEKIIDKAYIFIGNKIIGGRDTKTPVEGGGIGKMIDVEEWKIENTRQIDNNILIVAYPTLSS
ncbi:MAG: bifunctional diaminohydroxyphosphoribosylaminopyrimidine deaminase/5-amino-6-(5-phosphoribosylamino)uracil reductase RibD [Parcubacteria group bacterium]|nr:bifunctional diaminohydroxyphosphoribosylaminopyrimidine deaminase/5-amino-6-(5-phosphoribosylamino)uracil reductase RibD [Parcubacteria group bacterium]